MKQCNVRKSAVMTALRNAPSAEPEEDKIVYYLHITDEGKIVDNFMDADETFTVAKNLNDYFGVEDDAAFEEKYGEFGWGDACADREDDPESDFPEICEELAAQANRYLYKIWADDEEQDFDKLRFIVVEEQPGNVEQTIFDDPNDANYYAYRQWNAIPERNRKNCRVYAGVARYEDIPDWALEDEDNEGNIPWDEVDGTWDFPGAFDSEEDTNGFVQGLSRV